jgi:hypothetical protein
MAYELSEKQVQRLLRRLEGQQERRPLSALPFDLLKRSIEGWLMLLELVVGRVVDEALTRLERRRRQ